MATGSVMPEITSADNDASIPLAVDLDGTLIAADTLLEGSVLFLKSHPFSIATLLGWLTIGKQRLKARIAEAVTLDVAHLPYRPEVLEYLQAARAQGRRVVLATAANTRVANQVAAHLGLFAQVIASDDELNLAGEQKRQRLVAEFGEKGFDYVGSGGTDIAVWRSARKAVVVGRSSALLRRAAKVADVGQVIETREAKPADFGEELRLHHWLKNLLLFTPLIAAHRITEGALLGQLGVAFLAFGLCASGVYLLNDLLDIESDRRHPRKRDRPLASGRVAIKLVLVALPLLLAAGLGLSLWLSGQFAMVVGSYVMLNLGYSLRFKTIAILDVLVLAGFYGLRIISGSIVIGVWLSTWLLTFAMFMFLNLALVKRYAELVTMRSVDGSSAKARGYQLDDAELLVSLGTSAGYVAVLVLALYINSDTSRDLYGRPPVLWVLCILVLYWTTHLWLMAHRGRMHDDPLVFALRDPLSCVLLALMALVYLIAL